MKFLLTLLLCLATLPALAEWDTANFKCENEIKGLSFVLEWGVLEEIGPNVSTWSKARPSTYIYNGKPAQTYINFMPLVLNFKYINDAGESTLRFESVPGTKKSNGDGVFSFKANIGFNGEDMTQFTCSTN